MRLVGLVSVAAGLVVLAQPAAAQLRSNYKDRPSEKQGNAVYPADAAAKGVSGEAAAVCEIGEGGRITTCEVIAEEPKGAGFGEALVKLAPNYRLRALGQKECDGYFHQALIGWRWSADRRTDRKGPGWRSRPPYSSFTDDYPPLTMLANLRGVAILDCAVDADGKVSDCRVAYENPVGVGFGGAALGLSNTFSIRPASEGGRPVPSRMIVPLNFLPSVAALWNCYQ